MGGVPRARSELGRSQRDRPQPDSARATQDERRAEFLAAFSHELRTPLTTIVSFIELLRGEADGLSEDGLQFLGILERNADRVLRLIDDLLMLNRLEAGALPLEFSQVSLAGLATEAVHNAGPRAAKSGVTIHLDTGEGPPAPADPRRMLQVLDNLIGNAVKFSDKGGLVRVVTRYSRSTWRIDVSDTGIGIPPDEAAALFGPFVRGSNARIAGLPGTGLGLSIVKGLVEMHGGHVKVESALGEGTTFSVFLPVRARAATG
jgi:signal transduction histidine kinase